MNPPVNLPVNSAEQARLLVGGTEGGTSPERGAELHRFVQNLNPLNCLELGFAWGVSAVYIASALEANGGGRLTSLDTPEGGDRAVVGRGLLEQGGLAPRVDIVLEEGGYNYFLMRKLREQLRDGQIEPLYDFVFLDGAHTWVDDGFAFSLLNRLVKPGGWVFFDDYDWLPEMMDVPAHHKTYSHVEQIFELLVIPDPTWDELSTDGLWARARKAHGTPATKVVYKQDLVGSVRNLAGYARTRLRRR